VLNYVIYLSGIYREKSVIMPTFNFIIKGKKNPANIYVRFLHGKSIDISYPLNIYINPVHWNKTSHKIRDVSEVKNRHEINTKLAGLKVNLMEKFNSSVIEGQIFDYNWLKEQCDVYLKRPKGEVKKVNLPENVYFIDFAIWWLKEKAPTWKTEKNKYLGKTAIKQYNSFLEIVKKYEKTLKSKIKLSESNPDENPSMLNGFVDYMEMKEGYAPETVKRHVGRFRFFCNRWQGKERIFITKEVEDEVLEPILTEEEINTIFAYDFSYNDTLENVRDNAIIGCWTGLRISDFNNQLDVSNINGDYIEIRTSKTGAWVSIPLHPHVKAILDKRFGMLPRKISDQKFNLYIKEICKVCGLNEVIKGKLFDAEKKRNVIGFYEKYKLVSSHICRRSFATNLEDLVPIEIIQALGGWKTQKMARHYIKKTIRDRADVLKSKWKEKYPQINQE